MGNIGIVESFSTEGLAPHRRNTFWNSVVCQSFTQLESQPRHPGEFEGCLRRVHLGAMSLSRVASAPATVSHGRSADLRDVDPVFLVHLQVQGASVNTQDGRAAMLNDGDVAICDSTRPYTVQFDAPNDMLVLRVPSAGLRERLVQPEAFTAQRIAGDRGTGSLLSVMLRQFWEVCASGMEVRTAQRLGGNLLDLLVIALCAEQSSLISLSSQANGHRLRVRQYIEDQLTRADLDAGTIAAAMAITPRYVHRLFEGGDETLGQYIQRRRIEESARRLEDPAHSAQSVTQIAFDCAFNDASHFGRCFRKRYGMTPREYRRRS